MIYAVTRQSLMFEPEEYKLLGVQESVEMIKGFSNRRVQFDTETTGLDMHIDKGLLAQFGNMEKTIQICVDLTSVELTEYKEILETYFIIGQNLKFDCQVCFKYGIIIQHCWDCMIAEQLIYLGFPNFMIGASDEIIDSYCEITENCDGWEDMNSKKHQEYLRVKAPVVAEFIEEHSGVGLKAMCYRYLNVYMSKEVRGKINYLGPLDTEVLIYGAGDVTYLGDIMLKQRAILKARNEFEAAKIDCQFVPVCAYYEWCGVHMNVPLWQQKMKDDETKMNNALIKLNTYVIDMFKKSGSSVSVDILRKGSATNKRGKKVRSKFEVKDKWAQFIGIDTQLDLFSSADEINEPKCMINWNSSTQVIPFLTMLGFNCRGIDKKTKEEKDTLDAKVLAPQRNVNPEFYDVYLEYSEAHKVCSTYSQNYLNAINPITNRVHTVFRQLGTDTGRLACGSQQQNISLARLKGLPCSSKTAPKDTKLKCAYPQLQNLPSDEITRACFCAEEGNAWVSVDYCGEESVLMADLSNDRAMLDVFLKGEDMHSTVAYMIFPDKIPRDTPIKDIKKLYKHLRQDAKGPEFCFAYAGNDSTLVAQYGMEPIVAKSIYDNYMKGFPGVAKFQQYQKHFVETHGYIMISPITGVRATWWDYKHWKKVQQKYEADGFWDEYRAYHKGTGDAIAKEVSKHFKAKTKWQKNACNSPLQGLGAEIFKIFNRMLFDWIIENDLFMKVKFCVPVHDEIDVECPDEIKQMVSDKIQEIMRKAAEPFLKTLTLDSDATISDHWIH